MAALAEDVYYLYDKNNKSYFDYDENIVVYPPMIGDVATPCRLNVKCYINPNSECSICLEKITHKSNAYLTSCGHGFHKSCLFKSFETKWEIKPKSVFKCPLCRSNIGYLEIHEKYNVFNGNGLDQLENFWLCKDYLMCELCNIPTHYRGMKSTCMECITYRKFGK